MDKRKVNFQRYFSKTSKTCFDPPAGLPRIIEYRIIDGVEISSRLSLAILARVKKMKDITEAREKSGQVIKNDEKRYFYESGGSLAKPSPILAWHGSNHREASNALY